MSKVKFGWAIIGSGNMAKISGIQLRLSPKHKVVAVYSRNKKTSEGLARLTGATAYNTLQQAVTAEGVDGVYIATPHSVHAVQAMRCLELNKPVLVEKSITVNVRELSRLIKLSHDSGVYLAEAMWTRFNHITKKVIEWVRDGKIGKITEIDATFAFDSTTSYTPPRVREHRYAGGALLDVGVYTVSYCQMLLGKPDVIECEAFINENDVDAHDEIALTYRDGAFCKLYCAIDGKRPKLAEIIGTKGKITVGAFSNAIKATLENSDGKTVYRKACTYMTEFDKVASDIRAGKVESEEIPHIDSLEVMEILDECRRQIGLVYDNDLDNQI
jgi:Predicted dehydrogenases and related proteins